MAAFPLKELKAAGCPLLIVMKNWIYILYSGYIWY